VVVDELGNGDLVVATVTAFEVAGRVSLYQSARLTDRRWRDVTTVLLASIIDDACTRGFKPMSVGSFAAASDPSRRWLQPDGTAVGNAVRGRIVRDLARYMQGRAMECST
jgi:hypothetical protein